MVRGGVPCRERDCRLYLVERTCASGDASDRASPPPVRPRAGCNIHRTSTPHSMHIVIADQLPASAVGLLKGLEGCTVDATAGRSAADLAVDLAKADALVVRSATTVSETLMAAAPNL